MQQRVSIGKLMLAVVTSAVALTIFRSWSGPSNFCGFFGLATDFILVVLTASMVTVGRIRRFFIGTVLTAVFLEVSALVAPELILITTAEQIVVPVETHFSGHVNNHSRPSNTNLCWSQIELMYAGLNKYPIQPSSDSSFTVWIQSRISYFDGMRDLQLKVLIPQVLMALLGGFLTIAFRPNVSVLSRASVSP